MSELPLPTSDDHRHDPGAQAAAALREALRRLGAGGPARTSLVVDSSGTRAALRSAWPGNRLVALAAHVFSRVPARVELHGTLDLAGRRARFAGRYVSVVQIGSRAWSGRPGRGLDTLAPETPSARYAPLEVLDRLAASEDVTPGDDGRHLVVTTPGPTRVDVRLDEAGNLREVRYPVGRDVTTVVVHGAAADAGGGAWDRLPTLD
ncbi:hypothetical protein [Kineococcus sp. SYSU DK001]|uniref:hypothetical protein n=1 Tax=Kineococcus sp. SYSU DK001 TaxID=3383122 RepID=UPI003D7D889B